MNSVVYVRVVGKNIVTVGKTAVGYQLQVWTDSGYELASQRTTEASKELSISYAKAWVNPWPDSMANSISES